MCLLAGIIFVPFSLADYLFYPEVSWLLLSVRVLLIGACWLPAAIARRRRGQGSIYRISLVTLGNDLTSTGRGEESCALVPTLPFGYTIWHYFPKGSTRCSFDTLSADHPLYSPQGNYWRGSVWPLTNYAVIKGLSRCGHTALARQAAENHLTQMAAVYQDTGTIWENYSPEHPAPGNIAKGDFGIFRVGAHRPPLR